MLVVESGDAVHPQAPTTLEASGLTRDLVTELLLKTLHFAGELTGTELARRVGLNYSVIEDSLEFLKREQQIVISSGAIVGGASFRYRITDAGRMRAGLFLEHSQYVGIAPVPLEQYRRYMATYAVDARKRLYATRERVREAFSHLVVSDRVLDQLGPAINAHHSMFVYGPPGNGKTVLSQAIGKLLDGDIAIPHALEVEGSIIRLFDPVNHVPVVRPEPEIEDSLALTATADGRWIRCKRPMVTVGGELTLEALDLAYNATAGFYRAPIQALANGGVLVIDDFGRQHCSPRDLLNRWIVPLESRVDYMTLQSGQKFEMPFMVLVVFATNIKPAELVDEAFLRRIQYKIFAESPTVDQFMQIFENYCVYRGVAYDPALVQELLTTYYRPRHVQLRGCQPRDLIEQALSLGEYLGQPEGLTYDLLKAACDSYFVDDREAPPMYA